MANCYLRPVCNGKDCDKDFCLRKYKMDSLYSAALMTESQKQHLVLKVDADGTDLEQFKMLAVLNKIFVSLLKKVKIYIFIQLIVVTVNLAGVLD